MKNTAQSILAAALQLAGTTAITGLLSFSALAQTSTSAPAPFLPPPPPVVSTVPSNGDVNPYGVAFVPTSMATNGVLQPGDILVSNFNNNQNLQGTGTTITRINAKGKTSTFYQGKPGLGLTAALGVVQRGVVFVGNLPTTDGTSATVKAGSLIVLDHNGKLLGALTTPTLVDGPWGMAIHDEGSTANLFFSNVLNGTITRLDLAFSANGESVAILGAHTIASGFNHRTDPAALVLGPSGLYYAAATDTLYVASSLDNAVYAIESAVGSNADRKTGKIIYQDNVHLHGPIDLVLAPNGDFLVANSDGSNVDPNQPSEIVEFTTGGNFVTQFSVDPNNGGAFGIGLQKVNNVLARFAAVDDNANSISIYTKEIQ